MLQRRIILELPPNMFFRSFVSFDLLYGMVSRFEAGPVCSAFWVPSPSFSSPSSFPKAIITRFKPTNDLVSFVFRPLFRSLVSRKLIAMHVTRHSFPKYTRPVRLLVL